MLDSELDKLAPAVATKLTALPLPPPKTILNAEEAARFLGVSVEGLRLWRRERRGPRFKIIGNKSTYRVEDLLRWWDSQEGSVQ